MSRKKIMRTTGSAKIQNAPSGRDRARLPIDRIPVAFRFFVHHAHKFGRFVAFAGSQCLSIRPEDGNGFESLQLPFNSKHEAKILA